MACLHSGHSNDLISKPGLPDVMRANLIFAWHLEQRRLSTARESATGEFFLGWSIKRASSCWVQGSSQSITHKVHAVSGALF
jgi:hypothetical protein